MLSKCFLNIRSLQPWPDPWGAFSSDWIPDHWKIFSKYLIWTFADMALRHYVASSLGQQEVEISTSIHSHVEISTPPYGKVEDSNLSRQSLLLWHSILSHSSYIIPPSPSLCLLPPANLVTLYPSYIVELKTSHRCKTHLFWVQWDNHLPVRQV